MIDIASRPLLAGKDLDAAIDHARAALAALLRIPGSADRGGYRAESLARAGSWGAQPATPGAGTPMGLG